MTDTHKVYVEIEVPEDCFPLDRWYGDPLHAVLMNAENGIWPAQIVEPSGESVVQPAPAAVRGEGLDDAMDAKRYRRLRILGCAPYGTKQLKNGNVLCFSNLDVFLDDDLNAVPNRGDRPAASENDLDAAVDAAIAERQESGHG